MLILARCVEILLCCVSMSSSSSKRKSSEAVQLDGEQRLKIVSELAATHGVSKGGLSKTLRLLHDKGLLVDSLVEVPSKRGYERQVQRAFELDALRALGPYGPMLCETELPITTKEKDAKLPSMYFIDPFALLFRVCAINAVFFGMLKAAAGAAGTKALKLILYVDGINPGNPLAPDPQKLLQAVYWCFSDLPSWFLRRKEGWFVFSLVREKWIKLLPGELAAMTTIILKIFFRACGESFHKGITISCGGESIVIYATFGGILADEKGLKELFGIKGQAGNVPCMDCLNVRNRWVTLKPGEQFFWDPDISGRKVCTKKHVDIMVKRLTDAPPGQRAKMSTNLGVNYCPQGILFNSFLMSCILNPVRNYIRDWMHTYVSNGVAGTHLSLLIGALHSIGITIDIIRVYAQKFTLPRSRGTKVSELFFKDALVLTDHVRHFASDVLGMVSILFAFACEKVRPRGLLQLNIDCFEALYKILCILRKGEMNESIHAVLTSLVVYHNRVFIELYGEEHCKIKFHHSYHIPNDMLYLLQCLSCFPTERKNKDALAVAVATDKSIEKTAVISFLHRTLAHWGDTQCCEEMYLHKPRALMLHGQTVYNSQSATLRIGDVYVGDVVLLLDGSIGKVISLWRNDDVIYAGVEVHNAIPESPMLFELAGRGVDFIDCRLFVELVAWYSKAHAMLAILPKYG